MYFRIEKKIANSGGGVYTGVVVAYGVNNNSACTQTTELLNSQVKKAVQELSGQSVKSITGLENYRDAMKELGVNPSKYPCSIESILARISRKKEFPCLPLTVACGTAFRRGTRSSQQAVSPATQRLPP